MSDTQDVSSRYHLAGRKALWTHIDQNSSEMIDGGTLFLIQFSRYSELAVAMPPKDMDQLMEEIWHELEGIAQDHGQVFRIDSSEFGILWFRSLNEGQCVLACTRILSALKNLPFCRHAALETSPQIGVSPREAEAIESRTWVNETYLALAQTDQVYPQFAIFEPSMQGQQERDWQVRRQLSRALERQEFKLHYQPRIELMTGMCSGVEALLRWDNPKLGKISPAEFVPILEDSGVIGEVTDWVFRRGAHELGSWLKEDSQREFAFNVSARVLVDPEFGEAIKQSIGLWAMNPHQIVLEVTETAVWADRDRAIPILAELRKMGIKVAIDDFGTGFSTLDYLRDLPVDQLKIDRTFVQNMLRSRRDMFLVELVVKIAKEFDLEVVAEGAESDEILRRLRDINCDAAQGFAVARALPHNELLEWTANQNMAERLRG
jgi:EAL domain-containing protein (putative c-di-GMP-specific phosphodiesterase class I)